MQTSLQHRRSSTIVRASLDKRQVQLRSQTVRPPAPHRPLNREQKQKLVFFSQVRGGLLAAAGRSPVSELKTDSVTPLAAALATSPVANGECLPETAGQRSPAAPLAHTRLFVLQQEDAHETYTRISGFGEVGRAVLARQSVTLPRGSISCADKRSSRYPVQLLATEVGKAQSRLSEVMQGVLAPFAADLKNQVRWVAA